MSSFATTADAKAFFIERVIQQADEEQVELTEAERYMLGASVEEDGDDTLDARFDRDHSWQQYERKVTGLLTRAYEADRDEQPGSEARWKDAHKVLQRGDHYILVMLNPVMGGSLRRLLHRIFSG